MLRYAEDTAGTEPWISRTVNATSNVGYVLSGLKADTAYVVQIRAVNGIGSGPWSDSDTNDDDADPHEGVTRGVPSAPLNVRAVPEKDGSGDSLTVSWSKVTAANGGGVLNGYLVEYREPAGPDWVPADISGACDVDTTEVIDPCDQNTTTVTVVVADGGTGGTDILVRVRATTESFAVGSFGYAASVKTAAVPGQPDGQAAAYVAATKVVNVTWTGLSGTAAQGVASYKVEWQSSSPGTTGGSVTINDNTAGSHAISGLSAGTYTVYITANNAIGSSTAAQATVIVP